MKKILIIDDVRENLIAIKETLEDLIPDCLVLTAQSGKEGLKIARAKQPDTIITDIIMHGMDGCEICKKLNEDGAIKHIPVMILTGSKTDTESRIKCLEAGADVFLAKPIDAAELTAQINVMLRIKEAEDKLREDKELLDEAVQKRTKELRKSEEQFRLFAENVPGVVSIYQWYPDGHREYIYRGPGLKDIIGEELAKKIDIAPDEYFKLIPEEDFKALDEASLKALETDKQLDFEYRLKIDDSHIKWVRAMFSMFKKENGVILWQGIIYDITERKQAEKIQRALYDISNALNTTDKMRDFYSKIREYLGNVIDTSNFYVALYDEKTDMISLPFDVDEKDDYETFPAGKTITKYVIKTGEPLLATNDVVRKLIKKGLIETIGAPSEIWLGVPLKIENKVIGVIAVQSYDDPNLYTEKDIEILTFISEEIALAIKHKQAEEELKINRERLKVANSILRHDIANDVIVIKSALDIYRDEQDETMLDEIEKRVEKSLNTIKKQRDQEEFIDSHSNLDEYEIEKVAHDSIKNYPDIKFSIKGTGRAYADNAIYSVFENIISNAIKHGKTTKMDIDISSDEEFCEIRLSDYGIGIPDEYKNKIFEEGFQYSETGHTGIGLYIVKQTVEDYDGIVFVEDNKPNGAVFVIRLKKTIER